MSGLDKWFVFGKDPGFDAGLRSYESGAYADATHLFETFLSTKPSEPALVRIARLCLTESLKRLGEQSALEGHHEAALESTSTGSVTYAPSRKKWITVLPIISEVLVSHP